MLRLQYNVNLAVRHPIATLQEKPGKGNQQGSNLPGGKRIQLLAKRNKSRGPLRLLAKRRVPEKSSAPQTEEWGRWYLKTADRHSYNRRRLSTPKKLKGTQKYSQKVKTGSESPIFEKILTTSADSRKKILP